METTRQGQGQGQGRMEDKYQYQDKTLAPRQKETIEKLCEGKIRKEIADEMGVTVDTIRNYITGARERTGARTTNQLVAWVARGEVR